MTSDAQAARTKSDSSTARFLIIGRRVLMTTSKGSELQTFVIDWVAAVFTSIYPKM